jgi:hypothetical protein
VFLYTDDLEKSVISLQKILDYECNGCYNEKYVSEFFVDLGFYASLQENGMWLFTSSKGLGTPQNVIIGEVCFEITTDEFRIFIDYVTYKFRSVNQTKCVEQNV